jgi:hypothetical protein
MKKILFAAAVSWLLCGCTGKKTQEKARLDDVIKVHDKVMGAEEHLMENKMKLDTLIMQRNLSGKDTAMVLRGSLVAADSSMEAWMNNFKADYKGKTNEETAAYMSSQEKQIMAIDSLFNVVIDKSNKYLLKIKAK